MANFVVAKKLREPSAVAGTQFSVGSFNVADSGGGARFLVLGKKQQMNVVWKDVAVFDPMDWSDTVTSGTWYPHNSGSASYVTMSGTKRVDNYIPSTTLNNVLYIKDDLPVGFRILVDAELYLSASHSNVLLNSSTTATGTGTRSFSLAFTISGKSNQNFKMNGNESAAQFNDPNPPVFFETMGRSVRAVFEVGVIRGENKMTHSCYTAVDGVIASQGPFVNSGNYSLTFVNGGYTSLFTCPAGSQYGYAENSKIYGIRIQKNIIEA